MLAESVDKVIKKMLEKGHLTLPAPRMRRCDRRYEKQAPSMISTGLIHGFHQQRHPGRRAAGSGSRSCGRVGSSLRGPQGPAS